MVPSAPSSLWSEVRLKVRNLTKDFGNTDLGLMTSGADVQLLEGNDSGYESDCLLSIYYVLATGPRTLPVLSNVILRMVFVVFYFIDEMMSS